MVMLLISQKNQNLKVTTLMTMPPLAAWMKRLRSLTEFASSDHEELLDVVREVSKEQTHRETIQGFGLFIGWNQVSEFDLSSPLDANPFAGTRSQPTGKVSVKVPVDELLYQKMEKLNMTVPESYPSCSSETANLQTLKFCHVQ